MPTMRRLALGIVVIALSGCGFNQTRVAENALKERKDPSPLAHCTVAPKQVEPLVTEWPASSKARLETLLLETLEKKDSSAVAVAYSGCEMHIIDACKPPADYDFYKTTLARDAIEINDADELYAKLPLGALGLEGELKRSGKLTVQTVIAGQVKLMSNSTIKMDEVHGLPGCAEATHLVQAVSVGAFQLRSGDQTKVGGGVSAGAFSGGKSVSHEERLVREAGNPKACENTLVDRPDNACQSPIQLFLVPIPGSNLEATKTLFDASHTPAPLPPEAPRSGGGGGMRLLSYVLGGVGVVAGGVGALMFLQAKGKADAVNGGTLATGADIDAAKKSYNMFKGIGIASAIGGGLSLGVAVPFFIGSGGLSGSIKADLNVNAGASAGASK